MKKKIKAIIDAELNNPNLKNMVRENMDDLFNFGEVIVGRRHCSSCGNLFLWNTRSSINCLKCGSDFTVSVSTLHIPPSAQPPG